MSLFDRNFIILSCIMIIINDFANHYVDIGYRVLYSESIAGRGIAILISWSGTACRASRLL